MTESLSGRAKLQKAEREIAEFRKFQQLTRAFVEVNAQICRLRKAGTESEQELRAQEKQPRKRSSGRSPRK